MPRFVLTGAPGSGKTLILAELAAFGIATVPEPAREVIAEQRAINDVAIYDRDPHSFNELMLERSLADYAAVGDATTVYDRALPDLIVYAEISGLDPSRARQAAEAHRYEPTVFFTPSWREIYTTDDDRRMTFDQADAFGRRLAKVYSDLGYTLTDVPRDTPAARARFMNSTISLRGA